MCRRSEGIFQYLADRVLPELILGDAPCFWIVDDTGFPKKGVHSVGVARQYCGRLGKIDNCQVAVSLSFGTERGSLPIDYRLYLPREWAENQTRRHAVKVPIEIEFATQGDLAGADRNGIGGGAPAWDRARGCRLWRRGRLPRPAKCAG